MDTNTQPAPDEAETLLRQSGVLHQIELEGCRAGIAQALETAGVLHYKVQIKHQRIIRLQVLTTVGVVVQTAFSVKRRFHQLFKRAGYPVKPGNLRILAEYSALEIYALPSWEGL